MDLQTFPSLPTTSSWSPLNVSEIAIPPSFHHRLNSGAPACNVYPRHDTWIPDLDLRKYWRWLFCLQSPLERSSLTYSQLRTGDLPKEDICMNSPKLWRLASINVLLRRPPCKIDSLQVNQAFATRYCFSHSYDCDGGSVIEVKFDLQRWNIPWFPYESMYTSHWNHNVIAKKVLLPITRQLQKVSFALVWTHRWYITVPLAHRPRVDLKLPTIRTVSGD